MNTIYTIIVRSFLMRPIRSKFAVLAATSALALSIWIPSSALALPDSKCLELSIYNCGTTHRLKPGTDEYTACQEYFMSRCFVPDDWEENRSECLTFFPKEDFGDFCSAFG
jgi:hypothetical protein